MRFSTYVGQRKHSGKYIFFFLDFQNFYLKGRKLVLKKKKNFLIAVKSVPLHVLFLHYSNLDLNREENKG